VTPKRKFPATFRLAAHDQGRRSRRPFRSRANSCSQPECDFEPNGCDDTCAVTIIPGDGKAQKNVCYIALDSSAEPPANAAGQPVELPLAGHCSDSRPMNSIAAPKHVFISYARSDGHAAAQELHGKTYGTSIRIKTSAQRSRLQSKLPCMSWCA
jgi:hypothetical protein